MQEKRKLINEYVFDYSKQKLQIKIIKLCTKGLSYLCAFFRLFSMLRINSSIQWCRRTTVRVTLICKSSMGWNWTVSKTFVALITSSNSLWSVSIAFDLGPIQNIPNQIMWWNCLNSVSFIVSITFNIHISHPIATFMREIPSPSIVFRRIIFNFGLCLMGFLKWIWQFTMMNKNKGTL